ncbi:hypothetical protein [Thiocystis violacea]|uniref:hypothetical protein n=1 Tax=Thiocystis violacea TaxID=13725 RepID=UPI001908BD25|nr:hypothetical protein [Thiocystis violacea]MBK1718882.1 hypothetical protein [Thiocystis violacea]
MDGDRIRSIDLKPALADLGLADPRPVLVLVLVGGASKMAPGVGVDLTRLFEGLAPHLDRLGGAVIDGGTAFGVMAAMGEARRRARAGFPLIGVAALGTVALASLPAQARRVMLEPSPGGEPGARLDPNHSHFLLVPGAHWGDESPWISAAAAALAGDRPSLTLVAAGGEITRLDVVAGLDAGRPTIVLAGTGGVSDLLAAWWRTGDAVPGLALDAAQRDLIQVLELAEAAEQLPAILQDVLGG